MISSGLLKNNRVITTAAGIPDLGGGGFSSGLGSTLGNRPLGSGRRGRRRACAGGDQAARGAPIRAGEDDRRTLWTGLALELHQDDAESYYHNLMADRPSLFVVAQDEDDGPLEPAGPNTSR